MASVFISLHGLMVKALGCYAKGPKIESCSGDLWKIYFWWDFSFFKFFEKKLLLAQKTTASQTHFGFTNLGSESHQLSATAIWNNKISNETPCRRKK